MFGVSYLAVATLTNLLGRAACATATTWPTSAASRPRNLAEINELIIRRMRTGVLMVDGDGRIRLANEAALLLLGDSGTDGEGHLRTLAADLAGAGLRLAAMAQRRPGQRDPAAARRRTSPKCCRASPACSPTATPSLIFLDDTSLVSRRAESMTLAALGRFSASLAHEIRNPLAAISYAVATAGRIQRHQRQPTAACCRSSTSNACA